MLILITADFHIGKSFKYKKNSLNISERSMDFINQAKKIADYAIEYKVSIVVIAGDLYEYSNVNPTIKKYLRVNFFIPLQKEKIKVLVIGGNHDSPSELDRGSDVEEFDITTKITRRRGLGKAKKFKIDGKTIGFILIPYITPKALLHYYMKEDEKLLKKKPEIADIKKIDPNVAREYLKNYYIPNAMKEIKDCDFKFLVAHYHVLGTRIGHLDPNVILDEVQFGREMVDEIFFDLAIFGHVHKPQNIGDKIIIPGSIERVNFGELNEEKSFIVYDTEVGKWSRVPLECRKMIELKINLVPNENDEWVNDPTTELIKRFKNEDIEDALVKIKLTTKSSIWRRINKNAVDTALSSTFHTAPIEKTLIDDEEKLMVSYENFNLEPASLNQDFINQYFQDHELKKELLEVTKHVLEKQIKKG